MLKRTAAFVGLLAASTFDAWAAPCAGFTDVDSTSLYCTEVTWIKNRAITLGCTSTLYCPHDYVTRLQMAVFMYRQGNSTLQLGGNATGMLARFGTTDMQPVEIIANNERALRIEPNAVATNIVAGSPTNVVLAGAYGATIAGGGSFTSEMAGHECASTCGNRASDIATTVAGGTGNLAGTVDADLINGAFATVGGGFENHASWFGSVVGGGFKNVASGLNAAIAGGSRGAAPGTASFIGGGEGNVAEGGNAAIPGGFMNRAGGTASFVAGGSRNRAMGIGSFAGGIFAQAEHHGCFVFADRSDTNNPVSCFAPNEIVIRGLGGFYFWTAGNSDATYSGARLAFGTGAWAAYSDRNGKHAVDPVDARGVLDKLVALPISTWQWKNEPGDVRHIGPMAQDFRAAFAVGSRDTEIVTIDADGVALAAIQGLNAKLEAALAEQARENARLRDEIIELRSLRVELEALRAVSRANVAAQSPSTK